MDMADVGEVVTCNINIRGFSKPAADNEKEEDNNGVGSVI